jgi:hypothetical protein
MTPPSDPTIDVLIARTRRLEARVAQLEDAHSVYGVGRKRWPIPELTVEQRKTLTLLLAFAILAAWQAQSQRKRG